MRRRLRHLLLLVHLVLFAGLWWALRPDLTEDWPALLAGALLVAYPLAVAIAWIRLRGRRLGQI